MSKKWWQQTKRSGDNAKKKLMGMNEDKKMNEIKIAKFMHSKLGTLDYLQKFDISDTNLCIIY